ncbi:MAG TPA: hypothetical protein VGB67_09875 [Fibrella sp.]
MQEPLPQAKGAANVAQAKANGNNRRALSMAVAHRSAGMNLVHIASELNGAGFRTARGCLFQATQVMRLLKGA